MTGIYKIQSQLNPERIYIGSTKDIDKRWREHKNDLKANRHKSPKLQRHYNKYGENDFIYIILIECGIEKLIEIEQSYLNKLHPYFNTNLIANSPLGTKKTQEAKDKISRANKGKFGNRTGIKLTELQKEELKNKTRLAKIKKHELRGEIYISSRELRAIKREKRKELKAASIIAKQIAKSNKIKSNRSTTMRFKERNDHSSKYKGVYITYKKYKNIKYKRITLRMWYNNKPNYLGSFKTEEDAAMAYNKKITELFGENAYLNKIN